MSVILQEFKILPSEELVANIYRKMNQSGRDKERARLKNRKANAWRDEQFPEMIKPVENDCDWKLDLMDRVEKQLA